MRFPTFPVHSNTMPNAYFYSSLLLIGLFGLAYIVTAIYHYIGPIGESDDYMIASIALRRHFSDIITASDLDYARRVFPELEWQWDRWSRGEGVPTANGQQYTWYFPLYSLACIPFIKFLQILDVNQGRAFPLANATYLILSLVFLWRKFHADERIKFLLIASLCFSPIVFYISWSSAEVFICSLMIFFLVNLFSGSYRWAMLCLALAATLNVALALLSPFVYFKYFSDTYGGRLTRNDLLAFLKSKASYLRDLILLNGILLVPLAINLARFGQLTVMQGMGSSIGLTERFLAYWIDLNFGFLPFFPIFALLVSACMVVSPKRREYFVYLLCIGLVSLVFSLMTHINGGTTGLHRYMTWTSVAVIIGTIYYLPLDGPGALATALRGLVLASAVVTSLITAHYGGLLATKNQRASYLQMSPIARLALDHVPQFYNPLFSTFYGRVLQVPRGYQLPSTPVYYLTKKQSKVRKILATASMRSNVESDLCGEMSVFEEAFNRAPDGYFYIDVYKQDVFPCVKLGRPILFNAASAASLYLRWGWSNVEDWGVWSIGTGARIELLVPPDASTVVLTGHAFTNDRHLSQRVSVSLNGTNVFATTLSAADSSKDTQISLAIPPEDAGEQSNGLRRITIDLNLPDAARPKDLGLGHDYRQLGFGLKSILVR